MPAYVRSLLIGAILLLTACANTPASSEPIPTATPTREISSSRPSTPVRTASPSPEPVQTEEPTSSTESVKLSAAQWYAVLEEAGYGDAESIVHRRLAKEWEASVASPVFQWQVRKLSARLSLMPFIAAKHLESGNIIDDVEEFYMNAVIDYASVFCEAYSMMTEEERSLVHGAVLAADKFHWEDIVLLLTACASTNLATSGAPYLAASSIPKEIELTAAQWYALLDRAEFGFEDTRRLVLQALAEAWETTTADPRFQWLSRNLIPKIAVLPLSAAEYLENGYVIADLERYYYFAFSNYDTVFCEAYSMMSEDEKSLVQEVARTVAQDASGITIAVGPCGE